MFDFSEFTKEQIGEFTLIILMVVYVILGLKVPPIVANLIDTLLGKIVIILTILYLFLYSNPILAVIAMFVAYDLMKRSYETTGSHALQVYTPSEAKKSAYFTATNQFPYTLEQEMVAKMAPMVNTGAMLTHPTFQPMTEDLHGATYLSAQ